MQVSAEIRWFWHEMPPPGLQEWFCGANFHSFNAGGGVVRTDYYLRDKNQRELGVKIRDQNPNVEVKGLVQADFCRLNTPPFIGPVELWTKWVSQALELALDSTETVEKQRWIRKYIAAGTTVRELQLDMNEMLIGEQPRPEYGCNVELTKIYHNHVVWWTFGFEAFGKINTLKRSIQSVARELTGRKPPELSGGLRESYPSWFNHISGD